MQTSKKRHSWKRLCMPLIVTTFAFICAGCSQSVINSVPHGTSTPTVASTSTTQANKPFPNAAQIDAYLTHLNETGVLSGAVLVAQNGMLFEKGYGLADRDTGIANTPQTRFRIGSLTKQFTAMAILILQERGKLHVTDHLCLYIADCPQDWQPITIAHLLTHTSGIPDYTNLTNFVPTWTQPTTPAELISRFKNLPLEFTPGSRFRYSNSGFILLGYIIERVSGESYATFLQENIFSPLKMKNSGYDVTYPALPQHATGYYKGYIKPDPYDPSVLYAAGALYSTVEDLNIWNQSLMLHTLISQQTSDAMFTPHIPCPPAGPGGCLLPTDLGYGYGLFIAAEPQGRLIYHVGRIDGYLTYNGFYPASKLSVVVLSNLETTNVLQIGRTLASMV
ncbi:MAG TPA: serine hydrolase domain-containing protein [Ktedonobacteraceae bacterium]|nr:serine hydrolase domain-containing protein [Ktedonobacteraceae bacterium]